MKWVKVNTRETVNLWLSTLTAVGLGGFYLLLNCSPSFRIFLSTYSDLPVSEAITNVLFFWVLGLLWFAYHRWRIVTIEKVDLECVVESVNHDVIMVVNPERRIIGVNEAMQNVFGYEPEEVLNKTTEVLYFDRRSRKGEGHEIYEHIEHVGYHVGFATGKKKDGHTFPLQIFTGKLKGRRGTVLLLCDITDRVEAENELRKARDAAEEAKEAAETARESAEEANREKSVLVAKLQENYTRLTQTEETRDNLTHMIVHDMKLPLQVIKGYMELVRRKMQRGDREIKPIYIDETLEQTSKLVDMVHSLLDISRLESHEMPLALEACNLAEVAQGVIDSMASLARDTAILLNDPADPVWVTCDREVVSRVMINLLNNAVKYNPSGSPIQVTVGLDGERAKVAVTDHGPGIAPEFHERIFEKFGQVTTPEHRRKTSTGLGLTFCKLAVEAHSGRIGLDSELGKGCTFWFRLPLSTSGDNLPSKETGIDDSVLSHA